MLCSAATMMLSAAGCRQTSADTMEAEVQALQDNEARWNEEYVSKYPEKPVAHYADDAVLMAPGMPASSGKEAIRKVF